MHSKPLGTVAPKQVKQMWMSFMKHGKDSELSLHQANDELLLAERCRDAARAIKGADGLLIALALVWASTRGYLTSVAPKDSGRHARLSERQG